MGPQPGEIRPVGDGVPFAHSFPVSPEVAPLDRLVAVLGRDPEWGGARDAGAR